MMKPDNEERFQRYKKRFDETGIPICWYCEEDMEKIEEQSSDCHSTWKFKCKCIEKYLQLRDLRLSIG